MDAAISSLHRVDRFLSGLMPELHSDTLLFIASDHGNIEDVGAGHTLNPALGIAAGPGSDSAALPDDIRKVTPYLISLLFGNA